MKKLIFTFGLATTFVAATAGQREAPKEVDELVKKNNCKLDPGFYELPGVKGHPFDVFPGEDDFVEIAALCTKELDKEAWKRKYILLLVVDSKQNSLSKCPDKIAGVEFGSVKFEANFAPPERFRFLDNGEKVSEKYKVSDMAVVIEYDGVGSEYVCAGKRWASFSFH